LVCSLPEVEGAQLFEQRRARERLVFARKGAPAYEICQGRHVAAEIGRKQQRRLDDGGRRQDSAEVDVVDAERAARIEGDLQAIAGLFIDQIDKALAEFRFRTILRPDRMHLPFDLGSRGRSGEAVAAPAARTVKAFSAMPRSPVNLLMNVSP